MPFHGVNSRHIGAQHYVGFAADGDAERRLQEHLNGHGSPMVKAVVAAGIDGHQVAVIPGDRGLERRLHNRHGTRICPRCKPALRWRTGHQLRLFRVREFKTGAAAWAAPTPRRLAA